MRSRIEPMKKIARSPTQPPRTHSQLFPGSKAALKRRRRGPEQQGQSYHERILRLSHLPRPRTRPLSFTWQAARTGVYPQFLVTNRFFGNLNRNVKITAIKEGVGDMAAERHA